jgi:phospholipid/cholesterol/gamma-HCH transport system permease protein
MHTQRRDGVLRLVAGGDWTIAHAAQLNEDVRNILLDGASEIEIDATALSGLDTVGAWLLFKVNEKAASGRRVRSFDVPPAFRSIFDTISEDRDRLRREPPRRRKPKLTDLIIDIGAGVDWVVCQAYALISYLGVVSIESSGTIAQPQRLRIKPFLYQIEQTGLNAVPIVGLLSFAIGIVIAYQGADQLKRFGAQQLTIDILGIGTLRELGGLMAAIMLAGRSGSAFTAQIGAMKLNQEIDAIQTFGLDTIELLVLPRLLGLLIALPFLTLHADLMALLGGAVMCYFYLGTNAAGFLHELQSAITLNTLWVGLIKAPVFAVIIAFIGCFEGLQVERGAESIGLHTTRSVVESVFLVIIVDAVFSILFSMMGI